MSAIVYRVLRVAIPHREQNINERSFCSALGCASSTDEYLLLQIENVNNRCSAAHQWCEELNQRMIESKGMSHLLSSMSRLLIIKGEIFQLP